MVENEIDVAGHDAERMIMVLAEEAAERADNAAG